MHVSSQLNRSINGRIAVQGGLGINARPYSKNAYSKKGWDMVQEVEYLSGKHEALSSNPDAAKKQ
jgi:hypothetical protein